jgi:tRNA(Met) cytidine acetyltransferase
MILSDAPHHLAATVFYRGRVVNSLHLSLEGNMSRDDVASTMAGEPPSGHLIPTVIIRYYPVYRDFAFLKGIRIVRIATHPDLMGRGIGSYALDKVVKYAKEEGLDWIGSSFGATYELLSFWIKNGFFPIYLSPNRNPVSGEYSVIVIKPLTKTARKFVRKIRILFKKGLLDTLIDPHYSLDVKLAYQLLSEDPWSIDVKPKMDVYKRMKLRSYVFGGLTFSAAYDAIIPIVKNHFLRSIEHRIEVPKKYEYALISRVLQGKSWGSVASNLGMDRLDVMNKFRELIGRMRLRYLEAYEI